jgi:hypothetical protein
MKMPVEEIDSSEEETAPVVDTEIDAVLKEAGV